MIAFKIFLPPFSCQIVAALLVANIATADDRPNVILILADDLAVGDLSSQNDGRSRTPQLDHLAERSVRFTQAYSASCVCAPARSALLTGRYPHRTGVVTLNMNRYPELTRLRRDETTIADVLKANGYTTGLIGKWHCGLGADFHPLKRGFDEFEGFSGSQDLSYFRYTLDVGGKPVEVRDDYLTDDLSRRAIAFVRRHRDQPFFLHLAHYAPHRPLEAPAKLVESYREAGLDENTAIIYAMIEIMDRGIGELLAELDKLQLAEKTIVIFASDNGPDPLTGTRFNGKLRGMKYEVYEGGIRVPLFVRWPSRLKAGDRDQLVHFVDFFPTILDLCGVEQPQRSSIDGVSFRDILFNNAKPEFTPRYWQWNRGKPNYSHNAAMRDGPWKLVRPFVTRKSNPENSREQPLLYNLANDGGEKHDVAKRHPERFDRMAKQLSRWSEEVERDRTRQLLNRQAVDQRLRPLDGPATGVAGLPPNHTVTLLFDGPKTSETDATNPFTNYRLLVTFRHSRKTTAVRGFYAADGNAAHTHATSGNVWKVRFAPPLAGKWSWSAELRRGADLAISDDASVGTAVPLKNAEGTFEVVPLPEQPAGTRDLRKMPGRLRTDGHYFRFGTQGPRVLKVGANSPENLLAYRDFDGTFRITPNSREGEAKTTKAIHGYAPHAGDWREGDPTWAGGKGKSLIGAMNYLASTGMNSVYFLTMNIGGDGKDVWPYNAPNDFTRFDCSKLDQWEILFEHMQQRGLILHVITQETENEKLLDDGDVGMLRKLYYRELIARFAHHPALIWNLGEENGPAPFSPNGQTTEQQKAMADYLAKHDPYGHPIVLHTHASADHQEAILSKLLGHKTLNGISHQISKPANVHNWIAKWQKRSRDAEHPWVVSMDEIGPYDIGASPDSVDPEHLELRSQVLWGALMSGSSGVEWYFGYKAPQTDLTCEDWRSRDALWRQTHFAAEFFQKHLPYWDMNGADDLVAGGNAYCFAKPGNTFAVYRFAEQPTAKISLDLSGLPGSYRVRWFNPRKGGKLYDGAINSVTGGKVVQLGTPPTDAEWDWVILVDQ